MAKNEITREQSSGQLVEHLFRTESGKLVAILTKIFGVSNIQLAEDMMQDTLIAAIDNWSTNGIPDNPSAWLMQVSRRKVLNELKRNKLNHNNQNTFSNTGGYYDQHIDDFFLEKEIEDSQLRMIFTCCHPSLNTASQISLTLKTLCGFGIREVARALLTTESTISKRLYRAKKIIRQSGLDFTIPAGNDLEKRLYTVCLTLYLMFNEGYNASNSSAIINKDLCLEAMRLTKLLADYFYDHKMIYALLSLMCFHTARFDARVDDRGAIIIFEEQNRELWNKELISSGIQYLHNSKGQSFSAYHLEAGIAAEHCMAKSFEDTDWHNIYRQYELLYKLKPNPVIALNLAIIKSKLNGEEASLLILDELAKGAELANYFLLPATQGIFCMKLKCFDKAVLYFTKALQLTSSAMEIKFLQNKIEACNSISKNNDQGS